MIFNNHSNLEGQHAFLGASKYHWINYDETKVADAIQSFWLHSEGPFCMTLHANASLWDKNFPSHRKH